MLRERRFLYKAIVFGKIEFVMRGWRGGGSELISDSAVLQLFALSFKIHCSEISLNNVGLVGIQNTLRDRGSTALCAVL